MSATLQVIEYELELAGYRPGTPRYEKALLDRKVECCKQLQSVGVCSECRAYDSCELVKKFLRITLGK